MTLYHGSYKAIEKPDISLSRNNTDFGKGFYTTTVKPQAVKWSERFKRRNGCGIISIYNIDEIELRKNASVLEFETYSNEWLEFITKSRKGITIENYDLVIGGIANDDVFNTISLYFNNFLDSAEAIRRLRFEKPNIQYCFKNQAVTDKYLTFTGTETI